MDAFMKHILVLDMREEPRWKEYTSNSTKTTKSKKTIERKLLYEWSILMVNKGLSRTVTKKDGYSYIKALTTFENSVKIKYPESNNLYGFLFYGIFYKTPTDFFQEVFKNS